MTKKKSECWRIHSRQLVIEDVVFEKKVTAEEALKLYDAGEYYDIIDSEPMDREAIKVES